MNRKLLLAALVAVGAAAYVMTRRRGGGGAAQVGTGAKQFVDGKAIVSVPQGVTSAPLVVFFGGTPSVSYANKNAIAKTTPDALKRAALFLFVDTGSGSLASYVAQGRAIAQREGIAVAGVKALGFSAGGADVQNGYSPDLAFVGLIDPSTNVRYLGLPWTSRTAMLYYLPNWGEKYRDTIKAAMPKIAAAINKAGGDAQVVAVSHKDMVPKFLALHADKITALA